MATVLKLLAMPALVWLVAWAMALSPLETAVAVMAAAMPTGANAFLMAQRYQVGAARSGATVLVSTVLSVVTLGVLVGWFGVRGAGSVYYLAFALSRGLPEPLAGELTRLTLTVVAASFVLHGISVTPLMNLYGRMRGGRGTPSTA